ncbi:hypothetical protein [Flavobacterium sp. 25HG05S-40]|uniref:hypothetical protein n=1 Tax=Flavobacterium sp. 25HG05S-40 TaxID=3458682 RepID=UPI0040446B01
MNQKYFKSLPNFNSTNINVDRENGVLKNTCVANFGDNKNGSYFDELFLNDLVKMGNETEGGIKSRFGHPNMCATSFGTYIGRYRKFNIQDGNVFADLYLDSVTKSLEVEGKGMKMFDYILTMAENNPDMFGNSIHIYSDEYQKPIDGEIKYLHSLKKFKAVDLVDDPAATDSLFSSNPDDLGVLITNFLDDNPQVFEMISTKPEIVMNFFQRYDNYSTRKSLNKFDMKFFEKIFGKSDDNDSKFDIDVTLANGNIVTVQTEAEQPQVGDPVVDDTGAAVSDDTHLLPDGGSIVTVGGKITEINEAPASEEPTSTEVMQAVITLGKKFDTFIKNQKEIQKDNETAFGLVAKQIKETKALVTGKKADDFETEDEPGKGVKKAYDAEAAKKLREDRKK